VNYNFVKDFKRKLVDLKTHHYGEQLVLNVPFYGGYICLDFTIKDGFFMNVTATANLLNEFKPIKSLSIQFGTADVMAEKIAEALEELEEQTYKNPLGVL
jgi:hypothetical protein